MANQYVSVKHDSFDEKTSTESGGLRYTLAGRRSELQDTATFKFRHVKTPSLDTLVIDVHFTSAEQNISGQRIAAKYGSMWDVVKESAATNPGDWAFLREGELSMIINGGKAIHLEAHESDSDVTHNAYINSMATEELCFYIIDKEILKKMCDAKSIKLKLSGGKGSWVIDGIELKTLAQQFYNGFYDETMYVAELEHHQDVEQKKNSIYKTGCVIEVISVVLAVWLVNAVDLDRSEYSGPLSVLFILLLIIIPMVTAFISKKKRNNIK